MALFVRQNENQTEFQKRIATELQDKARKQSEFDQPDGVDDSRYIENSKKTTSLAWVWVLIVIGVIGAAIIIILKGVY